MMTCKKTIFGFIILFCILHTLSPISGTQAFAAATVTQISAADTDLSVTLNSPANTISDFYVFGDKVRKSGASSVFSDVSSNGTLSLTGTPEINFSWTEGTPTAAKNGTSNNYYAGFGSSFSPRATYAQFTVKMPFANGILDFWIRPNGNGSNITYSVTVGSVSNSYTDSNASDMRRFTYSILGAAVNDLITVKFDSVSGNNGWHNIGFAAAQLTTLAAEPTVQASGVNFTSVTDTSATVNWTRGNGENCIVLMKAQTPVDTAPADITTYTANAAFGTGTQTGTGNYVVYSGTGTSVNVTGLTSGMKYYASVFEFKGSSGTQNYLTTTPAAGNTIFSMTAPGNALILNGAGYAEIPSSASLKPSSITVEAWIKSDVWGQDSWSNTVVSKYISPAQSGYRLQCGANGMLSFGFGWNAAGQTSVWQAAQSGAEMKIGEWYHVAGTFDSTSKVLKVYINGVEKKSYTSTYTMTSNDNPLWIGEDTSSPGRQFKGQIDEVRIWNTALTQAQLQANMYKTLAETETGLNAYYRFDHAAGTVLTDLTSNNNHGTLKYLDAAPWTASGVPIGYPMLTTADVSSVTESSATAGGNVTDQGSSAVTERGVCWSTSEKPTISSSKAAATAGGTGSFTASVTGLTPNTLYYVRAYATSAKGTSYGEQKTFTTIAAEPTTKASAIRFDAPASGSMTLNWTNGNGVGRLAVIKAGSPVDTPPADGQTYTANAAFKSGTQIGTGNYVVYSGGTDTSVMITGLTANTAYYVSVYEYNGSGTLINYSAPLTAEIGYGASRYYVNSKAAQSGSGISWDKAFKTLQEALTMSSQGEIWVAAGTYYPGTARTDSFRLKNNVAIYGGFAGIETDLSQRNVKTNVTVLSGDIGVLGDNSDNINSIVIAEFGIGDTAILDGFTISGANGGNKGYGGGMYCDGNPVIRNCTFFGNSAQYGGGISLSWISLAKISYCVFRNNVSEVGGAMFFDGGVEVIGCTFIGNTASKEGGAVKNTGVNAKIQACLFTKNSSVKGGAVVDVGQMNLINCTFSENSASDSGGGIMIASNVGGCGQASGNSTISNCTITKNTAVNAGGGIYADNRTVTLRNTLIADNTLNNAASDDLNASVAPDSSYNIIETAAGGGYIAGTGDIIGNQTNLKLGPLADNGGPTQTCALLAGSAAIGAGQFVEGDPKIDQRGHARFEDRPDIGAYEYALPPGKALSFDGNTSYVEISSSPVLQPSALTVEAWIKADSWGANSYSNTIVGKDSDPASGFALQSGANGKLGFVIGSNNSWITAGSNAEMASDVWYHVAGTFNGSALKVYINGVEKASQAVSGTITPNNQPMLIGTSPGYADRRFKGQIDELRIWNVARTQAEIQAAMVKPLSGSETGLVVYYTFDQPLASKQLTDLTPNVNHGTLKNMNTSLAWVMSGAPVGMPILSTTAVSGIGYSSASSGGVITDENGTPVTARGVCWSTSPLPTIGNENTNNSTDGSGIGTFTSQMTPLQVGIAYYARAYATNASGTSYGNQVQFTTTDNAAPVLDASKSPVLSDINEDTAGTGNTIAEIIKEGISDSLGDAPVSAIAVTTVDNTHGVWQYSLDNGATWNAFSTTTGKSVYIANQARLLDGALTGDAAQRIRFVPDADWNGSAAFTFRAWDKVYGTSGGIQDASSGSPYVGGKGTFSTVEDTAMITVKPVNDAPVLNPAFNSGLVLETRTGVPNTGAKVSDIVPDGAITDADGGAMKAIAVTSVDNTYGLWQYSLDNGTTWKNFSSTKGSVVNLETSARLLDGSNLIRFVPDNLGSPVFPAFKFAAWDKSSGTVGDTADVTTAGGSTAFSAARDQSFGSAPVPGLWIGDIELTKVNFVGSKTDTKSPMSVEKPFDMRILLHADAGGQVRLLRHITVMQKRFMVKNADGKNTENVRRVLITDDKLLSNYEGIIRRDGKLVGTRLNSPSYGFDDTKTEWDVQGRIGAGLSVTGIVTLAADHPSNPFKHKFHPDHGTGYEVKRTFTLQFNQFDDAKKPESYLSELEGTYSETIEGIHKIPIRMEGTFTMKRMSAIQTLNDK